MKNNTVFIEFIERNNWEGETWSFFFESEITAVESLEKLIENDRSYKIRKEITKEKAKTLAKNTRTGYMDRYNLCSGILKLKNLPIDIKDDPFYKGGITNYLVEEQK